MTHTLPPEAAVQRADLDPDVVVRPAPVLAGLAVPGIATVAHESPRHRGRRHLLVAGPGRRRGDAGGRDQAVRVPGTGHLAVGRARAPSVRGSSVLPSRR
jgi:hypothetical protein